MPLVRRADGKTYFESRYNQPGILGDNKYQQMSRNQSVRNDSTEGDGEGRTSYEGGKLDNTPGKDTGFGGAVSAAGSVAGALTGTPIGIATNAIGGYMSGKSPAQVGVGFAQNVTGTALGLLGPFGSVANAGIGIASASNPAQAGFSTVGSAALGTLGSMAFGPLGGVFGAYAGSALGNAAYGSFKDGFLGDVFDSRTFEGYRDSLEDEGLSESEISEAVNEMAREEARGKINASYSYSPSSVSAPDPNKRKDSWGGNVSDSLGNPASVGVTDGSPFGSASVSNPGSTERGLVSDLSPSLSDMAESSFSDTLGGYSYGDPADMFGNDSGDDSSGTDADGGYGDPDAGGEGMI